MQTENKRSFSQEELALLREEVKEYMSEKRYRHTLAVEAEIAALGEIYLKEDIPRLRAAALLHDITKENNAEEQAEILLSRGKEVPDEYLKAPKLFHSLTAPLIIKDSFPLYADREILSAIEKHTAGDRDMTVFDMLLYLADYIEVTRTFDDCVYLRNFFYSGLENAKTEEEKLLHLENTMLTSLDLLIGEIVREEKYLAIKTVETRNYFLERKVRK